MVADVSKFYLPFVNAVTEVFSGSGVDGFERKDLNMSGVFAMSYDVNVIVSFMGDIQGNIGISMPSETAANIVAAFLKKDSNSFTLNISGKKSINQLAGDIAKKVIAKLALEGKDLEASPPMLVAGENLTVIIRRVHTLSLSLETSAGPVQINVCLESVQ